MRKPSPGAGSATAADAYVAGRPEYPAEIVEWLVAGAAEVADVGAGTGKLTAALVRGGRTVTAVEPDLGMLDALIREVPGARPLRGSGEALPLATSRSTPSCTARPGTGSMCRGRRPKPLGCSGRAVRSA